MASSPVLPGAAALALLPSIFYGVAVPARAQEHVTTEELLAVTRTPRDTLYQWVAQKLLPRPWLTTAASGRQLAAAWAPEALERVRFIVARQRQGLTLDEIATLVDERWPRR